MWRDRPGIDTGKIAVLISCAAALALFAAAQSDQPVEVLLPTRLTVRRTPDRLSISPDLQSLRIEKITPADHLTLGIKTELRVYIEGVERPGKSHGFGYCSISEPMTNSCWKSETFLNLVPDGIPEQGKRYLIEEDISLFETDVPPGHMWHPESSRQYRVLRNAKLKTIS